MEIIGLGKSYRSSCNTRAAGSCYKSFCKWVPQLVLSHCGVQSYSENEYHFYKRLSLAWVRAIKPTLSATAWHGPSRQFSVVWRVMSGLTWLLLQQCERLAPRVFSYVCDGQCTYSNLVSCPDPTNSSHWKGVWLLMTHFLVLYL